ncbi:class I adenylate-forming enzyme family protein [Actinoplanes sp. NPDC049265]|uniref:class I adenylate-forming enzyme family protein n=1 Tax=Actinoplanes sp. NPDC049265 TaxID=3363902 RepID=UPI003723F439
MHHPARSAQIDDLAPAWWTRIGGYAADLLTALTVRPEQTVLHRHDRDMTGGELVAAVTAAYHAMGRLGVGPGSVVAVLVEPNHSDMLVARYAANLRGAAVCYLRTTNPGSNAAVLSTADRVRMLDDTGAAVLYTDEDNRGRAAALAAGARTPVVVLAPVDRAPGTDGTPTATPVPWDPQRLAVILFTSGSTGRPKGIRVSGRAWAGLVRRTPPTQDDDVMLLNMPLSHTAGPFVDAMITAGRSVVLREGFEAERFPGDVVRYKVTISFLGTGHVAQLADHLDRNGEAPAGAGLAGLRMLIYTGSAPGPARLARAVRRLGPILLQSYGTTETGGLTLLYPREHHDPELSASAGQPFPHVEISVRNAESDIELPPGEVGEIWVRTPHVMDGYWNDPVLSARVVRDGWYATGDLGHLGENGYLYLLGRVAEVVKVQYTKVHPATVEQEILGMDGVRDAVVYGRRDDDFVESLHCAVVLGPGSAVTTDQINAHVRAALSAAHVPQDIVVLDEIPLNRTGKPDRELLRSRHRAER